MKGRGMRRTLVGTVVSDKMDKTVVVRVERLVKDPTYHKYVRRYSKFMAHDESNQCSLGDRVRIKVLRADIETSKIDFSLVEDFGSVVETEASKKKTSKGRTGAKKK